jgi:DNA-binding response OmpR family regulator
MCRAAVSIPSNVAEGQCKSRKEFLHHVSHSRGSLQELATLLVIAERRQYGSADLLQQVRSDPHLTATPFIMVTAESKTENVIAAKKAGVSNYIVKPFNAQTLKTKIEAVFAE